MKPQVASFLRRAAREAVAPVGTSWISHSKLCVSVPGSSDQMRIVTQVSGGRHGCGPENDSFWTRTSDTELFAGTRGHLLNLARLSTPELVQPILETLEGAFADADAVEVKILFFVYADHQAIPSLEGNSNNGSFHQFAFNPPAGVV